MKRIIFLLISLAFTAAIKAEGIDRNTALKKAQLFMPGKEFVNSKTIQSARAKAPRKNDAFYIFNAKDDGGYVIVSGDDRTTEVLGYALQGHLDVDQLPENLKWWLDGYTRQIEALGTSLEPAAPSTQDYPAAVEPLITAKWDQREPYNLMCPDVNYIDFYEEGYDADNRCCTGCLATAIAQVLYYWKWPQSCPALDSYSYTNGHTIKGISATSFKWDLMKDNYTAKETGPAADAVAELMRFCAQVSRTGYGKKASSASLYAIDMVRIFQFSPNCRHLERKGYTSSQWEAIIYDELASRRPVLYDGDEGGRNGHEFIVDGYDGQGLFHINWGWGGLDNGFYKLSILNTGEYAFQFDHHALINYKPAEVGETALPQMSGVYGYKENASTYNRQSVSEQFTNVYLGGSVLAEYFLAPTSTLDAEIGWGVFQDENFLQCLERKSITIPIPSIASLIECFSNDTNVSFGKGLSDGKYQLYQIYRLKGDTEWKRCEQNNSVEFCWIAEISGNKLTVDLPRISFSVNRFTNSDEPEVGHELQILTNLTNNGDTHQFEFVIWIQKPSSSEWIKLKKSMAYIEPDMSGDISFAFVPEEEGVYNIKITAGDSEKALKATNVKVAGHETVVLDGVVYCCTPDYQRAKVIASNDADRTQREVTIQTLVTIDGIGCVVKSIGSQAFFNWLYLKTVAIPEGIESIGRYQFAYCYNLKEIILPSSLKEIGEYIIDGDSDLTTIISHITEPFAVSDNTFASSSATLYVPIGTKAKYEGLSGWTKFAKIEEGEPAETKIGDLRYSYVTGGSTATVIQDESYKELTAVTIPSTITICDRSYQVTAIDNNAFYLNNSIIAVTLPSTLNDIGNYSFYGCSKVKKLIIPEGMTSIGEYAFSYIRALKELELPSTLKEIGDRAFCGCSGLTSIVVAEGNTKYDSRNNCNAIIETASNTLIAGCKNTVIPNSVTSIGEWAFMGRSGLTSITIPKSVTEIGDGAFGDCSGLTSIVVAEGNTKYDSRNNCNAIIETASNTLIAGCKNTVIPNSVTSIGEWAFLSCYGLTSITIPESVTSIGSRAFYYCNELTDVYCFPKAIPSVDSSFFYPTANATLHVPAASLDVYKAASPWNKFKEIVALTDEETAITDIEIGQSVKGNETDVIYDLQGHRLSNERLKMNNEKLPKGVYIVNGKKVLVK